MSLSGEPGDRNRADTIRSACEWNDPQNPCDARCGSCNRALTGPHLDGAARVFHEPTRAVFRAQAAVAPYRAWYDEAMVESNKAGYVGVSAAETIHDLDSDNKKLKSVIAEVHAWAVCAAITTPEDMAQNFPRIVEITSPGYVGIPESYKDTARKLRAALVGLVGEGDPEMLKEMAEFTRQYAAGGTSKAAMLTAINTLIETAGVPL